MDKQTLSLSLPTHQCTITWRDGTYKTIQKLQGKEGLSNFCLLHTPRL